MSRSIVLWGCLAVLVGACGAARARTIVGTTPSPADAVFRCAVDSAKALRFDVLSLDERERRVVLTRTDPTVRVSDPTFRKGIDQITVEVGEATVRVIAQSFHEYFNRRGPTLLERTASESAQQAARSVLERCGSGTSPS